MVILKTLFLVVCLQQPSKGEPLKLPFQPVPIRSDSPELITLYAEARRVMQAVMGDRFDAWRAGNSDLHRDATRDPLGVSFRYGSGTARMDPRGRFANYNRSWSSTRLTSNLLSREEAIEMARRFVVSTTPKGYTLIEPFIGRMNDETIKVNFHIGLEGNHDASAIDRYISFGVSFDRQSQEPINLNCWWHDLPRVDPSTTHTGLGQAQLDQEADRIYRAMDPIPGAFITRGLVYKVPSFSAAVNEMTDEHKRMAKDRRPTLLYEWAVIPKEGGWSQDIYVDARTGKGVAWKKFYFPTFSSLVGAAPARYDDASEKWQLAGQKGRGALTPVSGASIRDDAVNCVLVSDSGGTVTARYDASTNLVQIGKDTYRVSGAIITSLKRLLTPGKFGFPRERADQRETDHPELP